MRRTSIIAGLALAATLVWPPRPGVAQSPEEFYRRKNIRFLVGSDAGAGFSAYSLLMAAHLGKHVPGSPSVTVEHMPGAGGINSLNYLANAAPKDGSVIAIAMPNFFVTPWTEPQAVKFDPEKFRPRSGRLEQHRHQVDRRSQKDRDCAWRVVPPLDDVDCATADERVAGNPVQSHHGLHRDGAHDDCVGAR